MSRFELTKSIEAQKLNKRTGGVMMGHGVTIPYGSILRNVEYDEDVVKFDYLDNRFQCRLDTMKGYLNAMARPGEIAPEIQDPVVAAPPATATDPPTAPQPTLVFETMAARGLGTTIMRAKVPGGWLVASKQGALTFMPDSDHTWE
jgi:hypothetical protein